MSLPDEARDRRTLFYLEMTSPDQRRPAARVSGITLDPASDASLFRATQEAVGAPHGWPSVSWSDEQWSDWLADDRRRQMVIRHCGETVGVAELEVHPGNEVEITSFGLVPERVGTGLGGDALTRLVELAWAMRADSEPVRRIWLHTSNRAHPSALGNYLRRGFSLYRTVSEPMVE
jgi:GNAT superfamily N-acetyltransferase